MYILTLSPDGEEGAFTVVDDDGEEMLYLFEEKDDATRFAIQLEDPRRKTMFLLMLLKLTMK